MKILPRNEKQKFQRGQICKIVRLGGRDEVFSYPPKTSLPNYLNDRRKL